VDDLISGLVNFRDLGGHPARDGVTRAGRVFRSDSLAHAAPDDVVHLVEERGVDPFEAYALISARCDMRLGGPASAIVMAVLPDD